MWYTCSIAYPFDLIACIHGHFDPYSSVKTVFEFFDGCLSRMVQLFQVVAQDIDRREEDRRWLSFLDNKCSIF